MARVGSSVIFLCKTILKTMELITAVFAMGQNKNSLKMAAMLVRVFLVVLAESFSFFLKLQPV